MRTLADFKRKVQETFANGGTIDFFTRQSTQFKTNHPFFARYPNGLKTDGSGEQSCRFGRVGATQFTRIKHDGKESWMQWGKASEWTFPEPNTAVWEEFTDNPDHTNRITLIYKFNQ